MLPINSDTQGTSIESCFDVRRLVLSSKTVYYLLQRSIKSIFIEGDSHIMSFKIKKQICQYFSKHCKTAFRLSFSQLVAIKVMNCCKVYSDIVSQFQKLRTIFHESLKIKAMRKIQCETGAQTAENSCIVCQSLQKIQKSLIIRMLYQPDIKNVMEITTKKTITRTQYQTFDKYITKKVVTKETFFTNEVKLIEESVLKNISSLKNLDGIQKLKSLTDYESILSQQEFANNEIESYKMEDQQYNVDGAGDKKKKKKRKNKKKIDSIQDYPNNDEKLGSNQLSKSQLNTSDQMLNPEYCSLEEKTISFEEKFQATNQMLKRRAKEIENQKQKNSNIVSKNIKQLKIERGDDNEMHEKENQIQTDTSNEAQNVVIDPQNASQKEKHFISQRIRLDKYKEELERERKELLREIQKFKKQKQTEELYLLALKTKNNSLKEQRQKQKKQKKAKEMELQRLQERQRQRQMQERQKAKQEKLEREKRLREERQKQRIENEKKIGLCQQEKNLTSFLEKMTIDDLARSACHVEDSFKQKWLFKLEEIRSANFVNFEKLNNQTIQKKKKPNPIAKRNRNQQRRK